MSERIRWEPTEYGFTGRVGTLEPWLFRAWRPTGYNAEWELTATLPGMLDESWTAVGGATPDELKAEAERWLERFVSSLGASFETPDCSAVTRFEVIDHGTGSSEHLIRYQPGEVRSVVARGVKVGISFQDDDRTLKVFLADPEPAKETGR